MRDESVLRAAATHALPGAPTRPAVITRADEQDILTIARMDRIGGVLWFACQSGAIEAPEETMQRIYDVFQEQLVAAVTVEAAAAPLAELLDGAGVNWRLLKGPALAHLDYPQPELRCFGDLDVLVDPRDWDRCLEQVTSLGFHRPAPALAPDFDLRFGKGATFRDRNGLELDLHLRLAIGRFGVRLGTAGLLDEPELVTFGERDFPALCGPMRLVHACFHAALGGFREYRAHRDVAQLLLVSGVDWRVSAQLARRAGVLAVLARAITDAWGALGLDLHHPAVDFARRVRIGRIDDAVLEIFGSERSYRRQALTAVPDLVGKGATRYLWTLARHSQHREHQ
ncbi:hypothetical protein BN11_1520017 [Nostocoides australiense Ben110]|uniref:Nucleotidyltransferase family protein n=1 Tax=Nostocoides australiense Ben110 TaxID=1193182 RepID=W6K1W4_9MICO|nr:nucleotidyltransferase family protein [Tetrasphaera australiensis]CCH72304.1 hypothetical protein BN11_1520017 [Tetrasphaera australiensis Ben110]